MDDRSRQMDLAYGLLDLDLVDSEGRRCGKVDDLRLAGAPGETTYVEAIVTGPGALCARFVRPLRGLGRRVFGEAKRTTPWSEVEEIERAAIRLRRTAADPGLAAGDQALREVGRRIFG